MTLPPFLLLFDIDGTLMRSRGAGMRAMATVADRLFGEGFQWEGVIPAGSLDPIIFAEAAALNKLEDIDKHHAMFESHYVNELEKELAEHLDQVEVMPGIFDLLDYLHQRSLADRDLILGLLTGNYTRAVPVKLNAAGFDTTWFEITAFGDEAASRPDLVALAMRKFEAAYGVAARPDRVIVIGDTPRDVHCAKAHDCVAFAVSNGGFSMAELEEAGADVVVQDLADPSPLLRLLG